MRARIWGSRGSVAAAGPDTVRCGGNTSCVEVQADDDHLIVLDAGSGMRALGEVLRRQEPKVIHVLLTHLHLDHLQGLAFFAPFWQAGAELHIWGPGSPTRTLADRVAAYVSPPLFPVHLSDVPSRPMFHDVTEEPFEIGDAIVAGYPVAHQGPTVGFRVEAHGRALAYIPDHEPSMGIDLTSMEPEWMSGHAVAHGADVLLHDAQYSEDEYPDKLGWGHSSIHHAVTFAQASEVERFVLFHHDPAHCDEEVEALHARATDLWSDDERPPVIGVEGLEIDLDRDGVSMGVGSFPADAVSVSR